MASTFTSPVALTEMSLPEMVTAPFFSTVIVASPQVIVSFSPTVRVLLSLTSVDWLDPTAVVMAAVMSIA